MGNADGQIYIVNADGTGVTRLTNVATDDTGGPMWSPEGSVVTTEGQVQAMLRTVRFG